MPEKEVLSMKIGTLIPVKEGTILKVTEAMLEQMQDPANIPAKGGLGAVVILKKAKKIDGHTNLAYLPETMIHKGVALFLPDEGLEVGTEIVIAWADGRCSAAAVPLDQEEEYLAKYSQAGYVA